MKIPIYKAEVLDKNWGVENISGYLTNDNMGHYYIENIEQGLCSKEIDAETLEISFDSGKSFIKLNDLEVHTCTDFKLEYTNMKMNKRKDTQPPNGSIFTIITDKGR